MVNMNFRREISRNLHREGQERKHVNPENTHEMPVPARNFDHNTSVFERAVKNGSETCIEQCDDPSRKVQSMGTGKNVEERRRLQRRNMKTVGPQNLPRHPLTY